MSSISFSNCLEDNRNAIVSMLNVIKGKLLIRYLGVPLSSRRLSFQYFYPVVEKANKRLSGWK